MRDSRPIAGAALLLSCVATDAFPDTWARFRGPNGSGIAIGHSYPTQFDGQTLIWKRAIPTGKSSPIVTASHIFLTAAQNRKLTVLCLDSTTGKTVWERSVDQPRSEFQHPLNSSASATPATDGENVYAFFGDFGLISFDRKGKERWRTLLGPFTSLWGMAASPVLVGQNVVLLLDGFGESNIAAFDQRTGKQVWKADREPFALNYSTPVVRRAPDGKDEILAAGPRQIVAYDSESGRVRWSAGIPGGSIVASPVLGSDLAFTLTNSLEAVPSFDEQLKNLDTNRDGQLSSNEFGPGENARVLQTFGSFYGNRNGIVEPAEWAEVWRGWVGRPAVTASRLGNVVSAPSATAWSHFRNVPRVSSPLVFEGVLYMVANGGILTALDAGTGEVLKTGRLTGAVDNYFASPAASGDKLYFTSESGKIVVIKPGADWSILAVSDLGVECYATPALSRGTIFVRTANSLSSFRSK